MMLEEISVMELYRLLWKYYSHRKDKVNNQIRILEQQRSDLMEQQHRIEELIWQLEDEQPNMRK